MFRYEEETTYVLNSHIDNIGDLKKTQKKYNSLIGENVNTNSKRQLNNTLKPDMYRDELLETSVADCTSNLSRSKYESNTKIVSVFSKTSNNRRKRGIDMKRQFFLALVAVFSVTNGGFDVGSCQQTSDNSNNEVFSENFHNSLQAGVDPQSSTDNSNVNQASSNSDNDNINGGEINGATPFGSGTLTAANRNEKQPGLLCPDIYPVSLKIKLF